MAIFFHIYYLYWWNIFRTRLKRLCVSRLLNIWNIWIWAILWRFDRWNDTLLFYFNIRENFRKLTHVVLSGLSETVTHKDSVLSHYHLFYDNVLELERKVLTEGNIEYLFLKLSISQSFKLMNSNRSKTCEKFLLFETHTVWHMERVWVGTGPENLTKIFL